MGGTAWFCPAARVHHRVPRADIAPSRILRVAYTRGRNEFWKEVLARKEKRTFAARHDYFRCLGVLVGSFGALTFWSLAFTCRPNRSTFARAHAAAWRSGWTMDIARAGREASWLSGLIGHASFFILDSILWVMRRTRKQGAELPSKESAPVRNFNPL
jgi:hypothetical protein